MLVVSVELAFQAVVWAGETEATVKVLISVVMRVAALVVEENIKKINVKIEEWLLGVYQVLENRETFILHLERFLIPIVSSSSRG